MVDGAMLDVVRLMTFEGSGVNMEMEDKPAEGFEMPLFVNSDMGDGASHCCCGGTACSEIGSVPRKASNCIRARSSLNRVKTT